MSDSSPVQTLSFNPLHDDLPRGLGDPPENRGEVLLLLTPSEPESSAWPARSARALARGWSRAGRSVVLVDGFLDSPSLHADLKLPNREGLTDVLLFGASPGHVISDVDSEPFRFISAGTVPADVDQVWTHARWPHLLSDAREVRRLLILLVPANAPGLRALMPLVDRLIWLGDPAGMPGDLPGHVVVIHPASLSVSTPDSGEEASTFDPGPDLLHGDVDVDATSETSGDEDPDLSEAEGLIDPGQDSLAEKPEVAREVARAEARSRVHRPNSPPAPAPSRRSGGGKRTGLLLVILVAVVLLALAGHGLSWFEIPGLPEFQLGS